MPGLGVTARGRVVQTYRYHQHILYRHVIRLLASVDVGENILVRSLQDFSSNILGAKKDFCSNILGAKMLDAKQDFFSNQKKKTRFAGLFFLTGLRPVLPLGQWLQAGMARNTTLLAYRHGHIACSGVAPLSALARIRSAQSFFAVPLPLGQWLSAQSQHTITHVQQCYGTHNNN